MSGKRKTSITTDQQTLKIGSRVRCTDDGVEGRITWANGTSVKIAWADGEKVNWKRADLPSKGLEVLEPDAAGRAAGQTGHDGAYASRAARDTGDATG
jgi:hypothetical protein